MAADDLVVAIRCSERRFQNEWTTIMQEDVGEHYVITGLGGARAFLTSKGQDYLQEQLRELRRIFGEEAVQRAHFVLVAHAHCRAYETEKYPEPAQMADLRQVRKDLTAGMLELGLIGGRISTKFLQLPGIRGPSIVDIQPSTD